MDILFYKNTIDDLNKKNNILCEKIKEQDFLINELQKYDKNELIDHKMKLQKEIEFQIEHNMKLKKEIEFQTFIHSQLLSVHKELRLSHNNLLKEYSLLKEVTTLPKHLKDKLYTNDIDCSICLENIHKNELEITTCGHYYHTECFKQLKTNYSCCALCKSYV